VTWFWSLIDTHDTGDDDDDDDNDDGIKLLLGVVNNYTVVMMT